MQKFPSKSEYFRMEKNCNIDDPMRCLSLNLKYEKFSIQKNNLTFYIILHILLVDEENTILNAFSIQQLFIFIVILRRIFVV